MRVYKSTVLSALLERALDTGLRWVRPMDSVALPVVLVESHHDEHQHDVDGPLLGEHGLVLLYE